MRAVHVTLFPVISGQMGTDGFSRTETITIVLAFVLDLAWMIWLVVVAWRMQDAEVPAGAS
ncbi:MAG TPA: hypothetical protein VFJ96_03845 [Gemmatimonadaceae bacterium]|jgi:hypothetical protein|nr:hypothetical protein [Gemmatimonadaceae bacterium]